MGKVEISNSSASSDSDSDSEADGKAKRKNHRDPEGKQTRKKARKDAEKIKLLQEKKDRAKSARQYLKSWKALKEGKEKTWKFAKAQQNWIERNIYDRKSIPKSLFNDSALEYLGSTKGKARERILEEALKITGGPSMEEKILAAEAKKAEDQKEEEKEAIDADIKQIRSQYKRAEKIAASLSKKE
uniref:WKF domain-containing protein n=1 Tax=Aplanochytrium stocchinoi TaxID=215587 RepID=A0A6S8C353_9STRA